LDVRTKGEGSVKSNAEELGSGVECKGGASQSELGLMQSLMGVCTKEETFTFSGIEWEAPMSPTSRRLNVVMRSPLHYPKGGPKWRDNYPEGPDHPVTSQSSVIKFVLLIQVPNNVTLTRVEPRSCDHGRRKNGALIFSSHAADKIYFVIFLSIYQ